MSIESRNADVNVHIASQLSSINVPKRELAVVSPCSTCQNYLISPDSIDPNRSPCPRRVWQNTASQGFIDVDQVLTISGTSDPNTLANPAIDPNSHNYLVWVAAIDSNTGITSQQDNSVITPGILDPNFNNLYIQCRSKPYIPENTHSVVKLLGHFQENDVVWALTHRHSSITSNSTAIDVPIAGTVTKGTCAASFETDNPLDHMLTPG